MSEKFLNKEEEENEENTKNSRELELISYCANDSVENFQYTCLVVRKRAWKE